MTVDELEHAIQSTIIDFVNMTGRDVDHVNVDTRQFANYKVEVFLVDEKAKANETLASKKG